MTLCEGSRASYMPSPEALEGMFRSASVTASWCGGGSRRVKGGWVGNDGMMGNECLIIRAGWREDCCCLRCRAWRDQCGARGRCWS